MTSVERVAAVRWRMCVAATAGVAANTAAVVPAGGGCVSPPQSVWPLTQRLFYRQVDYPMFHALFHKVSSWSSGSMADSIASRAFKVGLRPALSTARFPRHTGLAPQSPRFTVHFRGIDSCFSAPHRDARAICVRQLYVPFGKPCVGHLYVPFS